MRLAKRSILATETGWIERLAYDRAEADARLTAWRPEDVLTFEKENDRAPITTADLQFLAQRRLESIEHKLLNGTNTLADIVQALPDENSVQRWFADQLEAVQGVAYTVVREALLREEKEPDFTLTSRASGVALPIEVKVGDGLSVSELEQALESQLCGQYLQNARSRHGILLLVHQHARRQGWELGNRRNATWPEVVKHLSDRARTIRSRSSTGPQPTVVSVDVSAARSLRSGPSRGTRAKAKSH